MYLLALGNCDGIFYGVLQNKEKKYITGREDV